MEIKYKKFLNKYSFTYVKREYQENNIIHAYSEKQAEYLFKKQVGFNVRYTYRFICTSTEDLMLTLRSALHDSSLNNINVLIKTTKNYSKVNNINFEQFMARINEFCENGIEFRIIKKPLLLAFDEPHVAVEITKKTNKEEKQMKKNKFYAVRVGRKVGIFDNWPECEAQVKGFSGAEHSGFVTRKEAEEWMGINKQEEVNIVDNFRNEEVDVTITIPNPYKPNVNYFSVDGTFRNNNYGGAFIYHISDKEIYREGFKGDNKDMASGQNHTGELSAAMRAVKYAVTNNIKLFTIRHDYVGVANYINGSWSPKAETSKLYTSWMNNMIKQNGLTIKFEHVKGHSGDYFNEQCDKLAAETMSK